MRKIKEKLEVLKKVRENHSLSHSVTQSLTYSLRVPSPMSRIGGEGVGKFFEME